MAAHITGLGKIMNKTEDQKIQDLLNRSIISLQRMHAVPNSKSKSTPINLATLRSTSLQVLVRYCAENIEAKKPEWQVLAEQHGWTPKT